MWGKIMKPYVITIARQYGSGGKTVARCWRASWASVLQPRDHHHGEVRISGVNAMLFSNERLKGDF